MNGTTRVFAPELIAAWSDSVESSQLNPPHAAFAIERFPATTSSADCWSLILRSLGASPAAGKLPRPTRPRRSILARITTMNVLQALLSASAHLSTPCLGGPQAVQSPKRPPPRQPRGQPEWRR